jgi:Xaa-Pro aminopeptidase
LTHQTFEIRGNREAAKERLPLIREQMNALGVDGLLVPHDDEYLNEYTPPQFERLLWASGFSGSAGALLVMKDSAILFIDGRYTGQARLETPADLFDYADLRALPPWQWLRDNPGHVTRLGYWSKLHSQEEIGHIESTDHLEPLELVALDSHPIDALWSERPNGQSKAPFPHATEFAGEESASKRQRVGEELRKVGADAIVFANPNATAWLLNVRGDDVPHTPAALCRAVLHSDGSAAAFFAGHQISDELRAHLGPDVEISDEVHFGDYLQNMGEQNKSVLINKTVCPNYVYQALVDAGATIREGDDPLILCRAIKNEVEVEGFRQAHIRDGVAMVKFLRWLEEHWSTGITEIDAVQKLEGFRAEDEAMQDISFDTISGSGPNGAIIHYRVSEGSNRKLCQDELFLVDSGGQYLDGTTDITRTVALGEPDAERKDRFTRVLQGHIALDAVRFPPDTSGYQLDILARQPLWNAGLDYAHGTGHGVGTFLGVHEGPQSVAKRAPWVPLQPGMILSNEPGYYVEGEYGIRIENLVVVRESETAGMLEFETLTLTPIDKSLIDAGLMNDAEIKWLDNYHDRVWETLSPLLSEEDAFWLRDATSPLASD